MLPTPDLQLLVTLALMVDAFILGATWQLLSDPKKRQSILRHFYVRSSQQGLVQLEKKKEMV